MLSQVDKAKRAAAEYAIKEVKDKSIIGLGSGSTVAIAVELLAGRIRDEKLTVQVIPASTQTELFCVENKIPLTSLIVNPNPGLVIDGADQVDPKTLNVIKGGGAAHTREKILASSSRRVIIIVDENKVSEGALNKSVPVEVIPYAYKLVMGQLMKKGADTILRMGVRKNGPVITDNGNYVIDVKFGEIKDPIKIIRFLKSIPGVVEVGIFTNLVDRVYVGLKDGQVKILE